MANVGQYAHTSTGRGSTSLKVLHGQLCSVCWQTKHDTMMRRVQEQAAATASLRAVTWSLPKTT
nr:MAG TPA: hypothetical protein [Caudoviricetes sp.]